MPFPHLNDDETEAMKERLYCAAQHLPDPGWRWVEERLKHPRTVTEDDLGNLLIKRAKCRRDESITNDANTQTEPSLKLYRISRSPQAPPWYDEYDSAVVVANDEDDAKFIHPRHGAHDNQQGGPTWYDSQSCYDDNPFMTRQEQWEHHTHKKTPVPNWWLSRHPEWIHPAYVRAEFICDYNGPLGAGAVISSSFNAG